MPDISKIKLPGSGGTYDIKDAVARSMISGGITFIICWSATNYASTTAPTTATLAGIPKDVVVYYNNGASSATGTLVAAETTKAKFYLVYSKTQAGNLDTFNEYVTVEDGTDHFWEKIGDTQIDLSNVVTDVSLSKQTDVVLGEGTTFRNGSSTVTLGTPTKDDVLGASTTFTGSATGGNVALNSTYLSAEANGTATAVTGYTPTTDTFLKSASSEKSKLVTTSITPTNGTESVSKVTKTASKLVLGSVTGTNGTDTATLVTDKVDGKLVTTSIPNVTGNTMVTIPNVTGNTSVTASKISSNGSVTANKSTWTFAMGTAAGETETLIISGGNGSDVTATNTAYSDVTASNTTLGTALSASKVTLGTAITAATGAVTSTGTGSAVVSSFTATDKTLAKVASSATTIATGAVASNGTGADVVTAVTISDKTVAKAGTPITVATGSVDAEGTGADVVTDVTVGTTASALTGLGTPATATTLTGVKLQSNTTTATGRVQVVTSKGTVTQPTITVTAETNDTVSAVTALPSSGNTAAAQTITVGTNDKVTVLKDTTDVNVTKGA